MAYLKTYLEFASVFNERSKKPLYRKAVREFLQEIYKKHKRDGKVVPKSDKLSILIDWALNKFEVEGDFIIYDFLYLNIFSYLIR